MLPLATLFSLVPIVAISAQAIAIPHIQEHHSTNGTLRSLNDCGTLDASPSGHKWLLWASCKKKDGSQRCTRLDLDKCYGDDNGKLVAKKDGKFTDHCDSCRMGSGNTAFGCVCNEDRNKVVWVTPGDLVTNDDGYLECYDSDHKGEETCGQ
ncbi:hypothetical protein F4819DRAFT_452039 [Hypoxylon fuscum]|nr:hypothetical protein F4819DRAFT_452039 [Hypoxylon fuscum]